MTDSQERQDAKWIRFREITAVGKTKRWAVDTLTGDTTGYIGWYGAWRQYCFFPNEQTVFERRCLRDLANFCESQTREYRAMPRVG